MAMLENLKDSPEQVGGWFARLRRFLVDVRAEMSRVTWPTGREVRATTVVVILTSILFGVYLFLIDVSIGSLVAWPLVLVVVTGRAGLLSRLRRIT